MFRLQDTLTVYLHRQAIDFRLSINGLAMLVEQSLEMNPFAQAVYVFSNCRRNRVKILGWDRNGFWLLMKRLEQDRFIWPDEKAVPRLTIEQLHWLLDGIDVAVTQRHSERVYERVARAQIKAPRSVKILQQNVPARGTLERQIEQSRQWFKYTPPKNLQPCKRPSHRRCPRPHSKDKTPVNGRPTRCFEH
jgi:transposase